MPRPNSSGLYNDDVHANEATPALLTGNNTNATRTSLTTDRSQESVKDNSNVNIREHKPSQPQVPFERRSSNGIGTWWRRHRYFNIWWWEAICCLIALGALFAIVATIRTHESKTIPEWKFGLTVNAVIAACTVVLKAAAGLVLAEGISHLKWISVAQPQPLSTFVAHDDASRGPMGALKLLWKNRYWSHGPSVSPFISSLGALITLFILLLDPFSQQIIRTYQCERRVFGENGTIARTNSYREIGAHSAAGQTTIKLPVRNAVYNGMFATQKPDVDFTCRTGNCNFTEQYTSLAYCTSCTDVTAELNITQYEGLDTFFNKTTPYTNVTLSMGEYFDLILNRGGQAMTRGYVGLSAAYITDLNMIRWDGGSPVPDENQTISAYRCRFYPCLKTFRAKVSTGRIEEELVEESGDVFTSGMLPNNSGPMRVVADLDCFDDPGQKQILKDLGYQFNDTTRYLAYNISVVNSTMEHPVYSADDYHSPCLRAPANQFPDLCNGNRTTAKANEAVPARCIYHFGVTTATSLDGNLFSSMFSGEIRSSGGYGHTGFAGSEALTALYNAGSGNGTLQDVERTLRGMTDTFTTYIRKAGDPGLSVPATAEMHENTSCIQVRWAWLAYAALIVGLLLVFFAWMVVYARASQSRLRKQWAGQDKAPLIYDYKSSALSVLLHGLDHESLKHIDEISASNVESEVEKSAKEITVKLVATEHGWKLSSVGS